jgi:membrane protein DedA with SNARE-associated domain
MARPQLPGVLAHLAPVLNHYGYLAVGALVLVEDFGIPVPGETILIAAAVYAGAGQLNVVVVGVVALAAAILGDNIGYAVGHFGGRPLALRYGRYVLLTPPRLDRAERVFSRHGGKIVVIARFIEGLRQLNGIIAGITRMRWPAFAAFNAAGALLWVGVWLGVGYAAGSHIDAIYRTAQRYELYALIAVAVVILALIARHVLRHRKA